MAFSLDSISKEQVIRAPRMVLVGVEKIGKTTFACGSRFENGKLVEIGINNPIMIPIKGEDGADALDVSSFPVCVTFDDLMSALGVLCTEKHDHHTIVIDSASALQTVIGDDVCKEFNVANVRKVPGFRTGESAVRQRWIKILDALDYLRDEKNMASIIIGHVRVKKFKNPDGADWDIYDFDMDMGEGELLKRWADVIGFCNTKVTVKIEGEDTKFSKAKKTGIDTTGGQRYLYTQKRPTHPGGGRGIYGQLPYELPLDWAAFTAAVCAQVDG